MVKKGQNSVEVVIEWPLYTLEYFAHWGSLPLGPSALRDFFFAKLGSLPLGNHQVFLLYGSFKLLRTFLIFYGSLD